MLIFNVTNDQGAWDSVSHAPLSLSQHEEVMGRFLTDDTAWNILLEAVKEGGISSRKIEKRLRGMDEWMSLGFLVYSGLLVYSKEGVAPTDLGELVAEFWTANGESSRESERNH